LFNAEPDIFIIETAAVMHDYGTAKITLVWRIAGARDLLTVNRYNHIPPEAPMADTKKGRAV